MFAFAEVEIAVGARRAKNADEGDSKSTMPSGAEKKSSFAADEWLVQRETAKKMDIQSATSEQDNVSSLQDAGKIVSASDCSSAGQPAGSKWTTSNWRETAGNVEQSPLDNSNSVAEISHKRSRSSRKSESIEQSPTFVSAPHHSSYDRALELYKRRYRSRSPLDNTNSVAEISHKRSLSSRKSESIEKLPAFYSAPPHRSYDRALPLPVVSNSSVQHVPLRTSLHHPVSSPATIESYSTKRGKEQRLQIERSIDHTWSQMNNAAK